MVAELNSLEGNRPNAWRRDAQPTDADTPHLKGPDTAVSKGRGDAVGEEVQKAPAHPIWDKLQGVSITKEAATRAVAFAEAKSEQLDLPADVRARLDTIAGATQLGAAKEVSSAESKATRKAIKALHKDVKSQIKSIQQEVGRIHKEQAVALLGESPKGIFTSRKDWKRQRKSLREPQFDASSQEKLQQLRDELFSLGSFDRLLVGLRGKEFWDNTKSDFAITGQIGTNLPAALGNGFAGAFWTQFFSPQGIQDGKRSQDHIYGAMGVYGHPKAALFGVGPAALLRLVRVNKQWKLGWGVQPAFRVGPVMVALSGGKDPFSGDWAAVSAFTSVLSAYVGVFKRPKETGGATGVESYLLGTFPIPSVGLSWGNPACRDTIVGWLAERAARIFDPPSKLMHEYAGKGAQFTKDQIEAIADKLRQQMGVEIQVVKDSELEEELAESGPDQSPWPVWHPNRIRWDEAQAKKSSVESS